MRNAATMIALATACLSLGACNRNTAVGNDRAADTEAAPEAAPIEAAGSALAGISTALIKPETMSDADVAALGGRKGRCIFRLTEVSFPALLWEPGGNGAIKLNGKLIPLSRAGENRLASGDLQVSIRPLDETGDAGMQAMEMLVVPPGAGDEIGYHGFYQCPAEAA